MSMSVIEVTAPQVDLVPGRVYLAKIHLTGIEATFGSVAIVRDKLQQTGFGNVTIWAEGAPADKFPDVSPYPDGRTFWGEGTWAKDASVQALPSQVTRVWTEGADADTPGPAPGPGPAPAPMPTPAPSENPPDPTPARGGNDASMVVLGALVVWALREEW
jgi:hypothetical protein